ncbi:MAG: flagellar motor switch protein FliN [Ignavibacteriales bacterium]|nr:flagellar motor switch protein FliN [Ignavibacteriales bacterium]
MEAGVEATANAAPPQPIQGATVEVQTAQFQNLESSTVGGQRDRKMDLLFDLNLTLSIELGRTTMAIKHILDLQRGSVVEFDKLASEPVDILINGKKVAEGEVVVIEKHFGIRITSLIDATERIKNLGK